MYWDKDTSTLSLRSADLAVMGQCKMRFDEIANGTTDNKNIPPLWSVLSYVLLQYGGLDSPWLWRKYRETMVLAKERDKHYRTIYLPKKNNGKRLLNVPDEEIEHKQWFVLRNILNHISVSERAYAYRKGISMADCAKLHVHQETLIHLDIQNFFGSISENMVFRCLERETRYSKQLVNFLSRICCYKGHLPQGASTSPALSNICFRECDDTLQAYAESYGMVYTRYSDDLYFSGNINNAGEVIRTVAEILQGYGFALNKEKTKVLHRNMSQRVLGLTVNDRLQVSRSYRRALRQELYYLKKYGSDAEGVKNAPSHLHYLYQMQGRIAYVLSVDPDNEEFQQAKSEICSLISTMEMEYYRNWLKRGHYGTFKEWKLIVRHPDCQLA